MAADSEDVTTFVQKDLPCASFVTFEDMRKSGKLCDLTIRVKDSCFSTHRVIIAAVIPYFGKLLAGDRMETDYDNEVFVEGFDPKAVESLIRFAYGNKVNISADTVKSLLLASVFLHLEDVRDACIDFLLHRLRVDNAAQALKLARHIDHSHFIASANRFIRANFEKFSRSNDFVNLSYSCIKEIICKDELSASSEIIVFEAVMKWVHHSPEERRVLLPELLNEVRMVCLPTEYLDSHVANAELITSSNPCKELVDRVKNYHLLPEDDSASMNLKTAPRKFINVKDDLYAVCIHAIGFSVCFRDVPNESWREVWVEDELVNDFHVVGMKETIYFFSAEIQRFNVKTLEWKILMNRKLQIQGATALAHENIIYFFSSVMDNFIEKIFCFDTETNLWHKDRRMRTPRRDTAAVSLGEFIYVTGGRVTLDCLNTVEKYSSWTDQWTVIAPMNTPRTKHSCASLNGKIFVCGGRGDRFQDLDSAEMYNPLTNQWNFIASLRTARHSVSLVSYSSKLYALGGNENSLYAEIYDEEYDGWDTWFSLPENFRYAVVLPRTSR